MSNTVLAASVNQITVNPIMNNSMNNSAAEHDDDMYTQWLTSPAKPYFVIVNNTSHEDIDDVDAMYTQWLAS